MKNIRLTININKPLHEVFVFTVNPANTHKWVASIVAEETNEWPVKLGTIYRNKGVGGTWSEYEVTDYKVDELLVLSKKKESHKIQYTFKQVGEIQTKLEYYEWTDEGELEEPFPIEILGNLKRVMEGE